MNTTDTLQERLGFDKDDKLLIIHADDFGLCHAENIATIQGLEKGSINSTSVMPPCPWFFEAMTYAQHRPDLDLGVHLTFTSEWPLYKWGPVSPLKDVPSLINKDGHFQDMETQVDKADIREVELEMRAQIEKVLSFGVKITHLDSHMLFLFTRPEFTNLYIRLGEEYGIPVFFPKNFISEENYKLINYNGVEINFALIASSEMDAMYTLSKSYEYSLRHLPAGLSIFLIHPAIDNLEMEGVTAYAEPGFGSKWRQEDFDFFTSDPCRQIIQEADIKLVTWKEIAKVFTEKNLLMK